MPAATYDDAALMVQLLRWGTELGLDESVHAVMSVFPSRIRHRPTMTQTVRKVLTFGEAVGDVRQAGGAGQRAGAGHVVGTGSVVGLSAGRHTRSVSSSTSRAGTRTSKRWRIRGLGAFRHVVRHPSSASPAAPSGEDSDLSVPVHLAVITGRQRSLGAGSRIGPYRGTIRSRRGTSGGGGPDRRRSRHRMVHRQPLLHQTGRGPDSKWTSS